MTTKISNNNQTIRKIDKKQTNITYFRFNLVITITNNNNDNNSANKHQHHHHKISNILLYKVIVCLSSFKH